MFRIKETDLSLLKEMIVEGVLAIQYGEHPRTIERKLKNYLSPKIRKEVKNNF